MYKLLIILGGPASGKGTLCSKLVSDLDVLHVSPGDLVRAKRDKNQLDPDMDKLMKQGGLLPTSFIGNLIFSYIQDHVKEHQLVLIDGFPRNKENLNYYLEHMQDQFDLVGVLVLDCSDDTMIKRTENRAKLLGRVDDSIDVCKRRIKDYRNDTEKVIDLFDKNLVKRINSEGSEQEVFDQTVKWLDL